MTWNEDLSSVVSKFNQRHSKYYLNHKCTTKNIAMAMDCIIKATLIVIQKYEIRDVELTFHNRLSKLSLERFSSSSTFRQTPFSKSSFMCTKIFVDVLFLYLFSKEEFYLKKTIEITFLIVELKCIWLVSE